MGRNTRRNRDRGFWPAMQLYATAISTARRAGLGPGDVVVAAVSGGPDSCALMNVLGRARGDSRFGFRVQPAHLIHDFRGQETYDDADFVRRMWPNCIVDEVDVAAYQRQAGVSSFEQAARDVRYDFLARVAQRVGARLVAVGHTADDLAETVLLHLARGSGLHGLRGMNEIDDWPYPSEELGTAGLKVWRPLLALTRHHTISYCRNYGVDYRDDSTNYMREFARNRVRHDLMPALKEQLNPRIVAALGRLSRTASLQVDYMEREADSLWPEVSPGPAGEGVLHLDRERLAEAHPAMQHILLRRAWLTVTGHERRLTERHLAAMAWIVANPGSGKTVELPRGYRFSAKGSRATLAAPSAPPADFPYPPLSREFRITLPWGPIAVGVTRQDPWEVTARAVRLEPEAPLDTGDPMASYLSPEALSEGAMVRTRRPGDLMQPLGMTGSRKLQDLFTDAGVPREWRDRVPLVVTPRGVAWAVGIRIADWAGVRPGSGGERPATLVRFEISAQ